MSGFTNNFKHIATDNEIAYCKNGHVITEDNIYTSGFKRRCRKCQLKHATNYRERVRYETNSRWRPTSA